MTQANKQQDIKLSQKTTLQEALTQEDQKALNEIGTILNYETGDYVIRENAQSDSFFIIQSGVVEIIKDGIVLGSKSSGEEFGVMSLTNESNRSASAVAKEKTSILSIPFKAIKNPKYKDVYNSVVLNHLQNQSDDLRRMNETTIKETKTKIAILQEKMVSSRFFLRIVTGLIVYQFIFGYLIEYNNAISQTRLFNLLVEPITILVFGLVTLQLAYQSPRPFKEYGITWGNLKKEIPQALVWSLLFCLFIIGLKYIATIIPGSGYYQRPVLEKQALWGLETGRFIFILILYWILVPIQEFAARGVLQTELKKIFEGDYSHHYAILLANGIFSAFHLMLDVRFAFFTFLPGLFWGYLFDKQESLAGVILSHQIIGTFAILFISSA